MSRALTVNDKFKTLTHGFYTDFTDVLLVCIFRVAQVTANKSVFML